MRARDMDGALAELASHTLESHFAVVAVGGYGRGDLAPHSDIDLLLLCPPRQDVPAQAIKGFLYPMWDGGFQVGHAVASPKDAIGRASASAEAATSLLSARLVAGSRELFEELLDRRSRWLHRDRRALARRILEGVAQRHRNAARAGWMLAPNLKDDVGGLRDFHSVGWLAELVGVQTPPSLHEPAGILLAAREAVHAEAGRKSDRLRLDLQSAVSRRLGLEDADKLMLAVHRAARSIEHDAALSRAELAEMLLGGPRRSGLARRLSEIAVVEEGEVVARRVDSMSDVVSVMASAAEHGLPLAGKTQHAIHGAILRGGDWNSQMRADFSRLLGGKGVVQVLELLDHFGGFDVLLPEFCGVIALAQHDPYHRYTVDAHSFVCVEELRKVIADDPAVRVGGEELGDLFTLRLAALLHDAGKGSGGDHSNKGQKLACAAALRMGLDEDGADEVAWLVRHHLTLSDTATRRDLDDGAVIEHVATLAGSPRRLRLLYLLSVADGRATGPEAWSDWKAALVRELLRKGLVALETGQLPPRTDVEIRAREIEAYEPSLASLATSVLSTLPPSYLSAAEVPDMADDVRLLTDPPSPGQIRCRVEEGAEAVAVTVCVHDRPGTLARTAGVLALNGLSVLKAQAYSTTTGYALERFTVAKSRDSDFNRLQDDLEAAYSGTLALGARLENKILDYRPSGSIAAEVRILPEASLHSTVIEVRAPDVLGLLYVLTSALSELDLDIHVAKIDTLGSRVVDVFYVRTAWGTALSPEQMNAAEQSLTHAVQRAFGSKSS